MVVTSCACRGMVLTLVHVCVCVCIISTTRGSVRARHYDRDDVGDFHFGDDTDAQRHHPHNNGMYRLSNNASLDSQKYQRPRASGTAIRPGASLATNDEEKQLSTMVGMSKRSLGRITHSISPGLIVVVVVVCAFY